MVVYSERGRKGLLRHVWVMGGVGLCQKKLFNVDCQRFRDFAPILSRPARIFNRFGSYFQIFSPNPSKRLELGQTKARNGLSTLKIGGYHVVSPWDPLLLTQRPPCRARQ